MAVGNIDLSKVNISLAEFQHMSDGKYNAGEVKLSSETGLKTVNNHIHRLGANKVEIPHEEVLAIKEAFVKALDFDAVNGPAANAESLRYALDRAAELPVEFGDVH